MDHEQNVKRLYEAALQKQGAERAAFLDHACAGDDALRREIESQLHPDSFVGREISHYKVLSLLGAGGMGQVYLAEDKRLERRVALKILPAEVARDPERMRRFLREAKATSALNHSNVAVIHDVGEAGDIRFIAMEYVEGQTLSARIRNGPMEPDAILKIALQAADALEAAHGKGITHRDIKPDNLMITANGDVKVLDFGLAKVAPHLRLTAAVS